MMLEFLPDKFKFKLKAYFDKNLSEIRIRQNKSIVILYKGKNIKLNVVATHKDVEEMLLNACKRSVYSYDNQIKQGFVTTDCGERIGLAGEFVFNGLEIQSIRSFSSLCIRIPCEVNGVSNKFYQEVYKGGSVLVISKTGDGKTTFIRDFCKNVSNKLNTVLIDERNEIAGKSNEFTFNVGENTDVLTYSTKLYGFNQAIRTLNPRVIVTDELIYDSDFEGVYFAINSGVDVIATIHGNSVNMLNNNLKIKPLIDEKCFDYYVLLINDLGDRKQIVYDKNLESLCCI